ncbi:MAG: hypothetical protein M1119_00325 [Firmicutes bacterium]|nr:hypothetical protein [Bacillota bacterium]
METGLIFNADKFRQSSIVRVAGYSDYFCNPSKVLQDEIIARTEHKPFNKEAVLCGIR